MFRLAARFAGGTSGCGSESDNLEELMEEANYLVENDRVVWIRIEEKNGPTILECMAHKSYFNELYSEQIKKCHFGKEVI